MLLLDNRTPAPLCKRWNRAVVIGMRLAKRTGSVICGSRFVWSALSLTILNMSGVSVLPHKSADDSVIDVQVDTNIPIRHPCPMHPNYLPSDIFGYSPRWHIKKVTLSNLLSTYESQEFPFIILRFSNLYPIICLPHARSR